MPSVNFSLTIRKLTIRKLIPFGFILFPFWAYPQGHSSICGNDLLLDEIKRDPELKANYELTQEVLRSLQTKNYKTVNTPGGIEYHIPVVVHVMHTGGAVGTNYNPNDQVIQSYINLLNQAFSNTYDHPSVPGGFNSVSTPFRFYLALRDKLTNCGPTTGINRVNLSSNATYVASGVSILVPVVREFPIRR
jgi:hypothetical protein